MKEQSIGITQIGADGKPYRTFIESSHGRGSSEIIYQLGRRFNLERTVITLGGKTIWSPDDPYFGRLNHA